MAMEEEGPIIGARDSAMRGGRPLGSFLDRWNRWSKPTAPAAPPLEEGSVIPFFGPFFSFSFVTTAVVLVGEEARTRPGTGTVDPNETVDGATVLVEAVSVLEDGGA